MNGWIKIHRQITEWEWYTDSHMVHLFIHLIATANIEDKNYKGQTIKRGQLVTSVSKLKDETGIPTQTIRTCIARLQQSGEISSSSTNKFTVITICKYESYQVENFAANKQLTNNQQTKIEKSTNKKEGLTSNQSDSYEAENFAANKQNSKNQQTKIDAFNIKKKNKNNIIIAAKAAGTVRDAHAREREAEILEAGETGDTSPARASETTASDIEAVRLYYNEQLQATGSVMPRAKCKLTGKREAYVRARIKQYGKDAVREVIEMACRSEFLNGAGDRGFIADLEWLMRPNNFPKVYDGKFNRKGKGALESERLKQETQTRTEMAALLDEMEQEKQQRRQIEAASVTGQQWTPDNNQDAEQRSRYEGMIAIYRQNPKSYSVKPLLIAYQNGTLRKLGIDWQPS